MNEHFESLKSVYSNTSFFTLQKKKRGAVIERHKRLGSDRCLSRFLGQTFNREKAAKNFRRSKAVCHETASYHVRQRV